MQARIEALFGYAVDERDVAQVDEWYLPPADAENPFEAAVESAQAEFPELNLQALFAEVLCGTRSDGAGDVFCPAFAAGERAAVVEWHHDEPLSWGAAARSFEELDRMQAVLDELNDLELDEDVDDLIEQAGELGTRDERIAAIENDDLRALIARWPDAPPPPSYDFGEWNELLEYFYEPDPTSGAARARTRLRDAAWIVSALTEGGLGQVPADDDIERALDTLQARGALGVGEQLYALWASWLTGRDDRARQLCGRAVESPSSLVRGAAALVLRALDGDTTIGAVDLGPVRTALVARTKVAPGMLSTAELRAGRAAVRTLVMPTRREWNPGYVEYTNLEILETSIGDVPPEIGALRKLRRFTCHSSLPDEIAQLTELAELGCRSLPPSATALTKLRALKVSHWEGQATAAVIPELVGLEQLDIYALSHLTLPESVSALTQLRTLKVTAAGTSRVRLSAAVAALPALETLVVSGTVDELPADWSHARALREVTFTGTVPKNLGVLATAPALRSLTFTQSEYAPVPDLSAFADLDVLHIAGNVNDHPATARAVRTVRKLRRLDYRAGVKFGTEKRLPEELLGIDIDELQLIIPSDSPWAEVERLLRSIPALRALTLVGSGAVQEAGGPPPSPWPGLEYLDLSHSHSWAPLFPNIGELPALRELVLGRSDAGLIRPGSRGTFLDGLASCARLEVARLAGVELPEAHLVALGELESLRELDLVQCGLTSLPEHFAARSPLAVLDLRGNPLAQLPASIGTLPLRTLRLGVTAIANLDDLSPPTQLEHLDLSSPALARVPAWLPELVHLRRLELGGPAIDLEHALALASQLPTLRELVIRNVQRDGIPPSLLRMTHLETLDLVATSFQAPLIQVRVQLPNTTLRIEETVKDSADRPPLGG